MSLSKFRNEDLSVFFFIKKLPLTDSKTLDEVVVVVDGYPYTQIESGQLVIPCVSIEVRQTAESGGELGSSWFKRNWVLDVFANNDTQRDDIADLIFRALDNAIPIRDYSGGFNKDTGKSLSNVDKRIIEYVSPEARAIRVSYAFEDAKIKWWKATIMFDTTSTQSG
jgi:hypothetical protein